MNVSHTLEDWDKHFLDIASLCSKMSKDPSTKVGAAIKGHDKSVISTGYNGFPPGVPDCSDRLNNREEKYKVIIHAEENALRFAARSLIGATIYTTMIPCEKCFELILQAGIKRIVSFEPDENILERWGPQFKRVLTHAPICGIEITLYPRSKE